jgi:hypothetical protein
MEKKHLYVLVIAAIVGLVLILPASAAISFQKYTPTGNTLFKPVVTPSPSVPFKNFPVFIQPELIYRDKSSTTNFPIFTHSTLYRGPFLIKPVQTITPDADPGNYFAEDPFFITITVWDKDHTQTISDASLTFQKIIVPEQKGEAILNGFSTKLIATGKTDANGQFTIGIHQEDNPSQVSAQGPVFLENGVMVFYSHPSQWISYGLFVPEHEMDIVLDQRQVVQ